MAIVIAIAMAMAKALALALACAHSLGMGRRMARFGKVKNMEAALKVGMAQRQAMALVRGLL